MKKLTLLLYVIFLSLCIPTKAQTNPKQAAIDSMMSLLPASSEDTNKVQLLVEIGKKHGMSNSKEALNYAMQGLSLSEKLEFKSGIANACYYIGNIYGRLGQTDSAFKYYFIALDIVKEKGEKEEVASVFTNLGGMYMSTSNYPRSLEYFFQALRLFEENGNKNGQANCYANISNIYNLQEDYANTLKYCKKALDIYRLINQKFGIALVEGNIGDAYAAQRDYDSALPYLERSLALYKELGESSGIERNLSNFASLYMHKGNYVKALENIFSALNIAKSEGLYDAEGYNFSIAGEIYLTIATDKRENLTGPVLNSSKESLILAGSYTDSAITILKVVGDLNALFKAYEQLSKIQSLQGDYQSAYQSHLLFKQLNDSVFNMEKDKKLTQTSMQYEFDKKEAITKSEQEKKDIQQRNIRNSIAAGLAGSLIFALVVFRQRNKISKEKKRSEELLLNILPEEVAEELKLKGSADAKQFDEVTVMFTDFRGFTQISEKLSPAELVEEIDTCFKAFDRIITKYNIEKIKTIGDSYMCAGGLPVSNSTHAVDVVSAALEIQKFMLEHSRERKNSGKEIFEIRIGVHTGPVVAGIVGLKKFAYDIWGDTVNIASRMESSSEPGKINISGHTHKLVQSHFICQHRGKIQAKNKGEIDMYFVSGRK